MWVVFVRYTIHEGDDGKGSDPGAPVMSMSQEKTNKMSFQSQIGFVSSTGTVSRFWYRIPYAIIVFEEEDYMELLRQE